MTGIRPRKPEVTLEISKPLSFYREGGWGSDGVSGVPKTSFAEVEEKPGDLTPEPGLSLYTETSR